MSSDETLTIDTPEQMRLEYPLAGVGSRALALMMDSLYQIAILAVLLLVALGLGLTGRMFGSEGAWVMAFLILGLFAIQFGYYALFEALWSGQTPGKRQMKLRVIRTNGRPLTAAGSVARNLMRLVDSLPSLYGIGILVVMLTPRRQRLGDLLAGTVVVHEASATAAPPPWLDAALPAATASGLLTPEELRLVETFLERRDGMVLDARVRLAGQIADRIGARLRVEYEDRRDGEAWLAGLVRRTREHA